MSKDLFEISKTTVWKALTGIFGILFVISLFTGGFGIGDDSGTGAVVAPSNPTQPSIPTGIAAVNAEELADDDPFMGEKNAPVTIVEFSDFQCSYCAMFRSDTFEQIKKEYIDTGKVKFVYRDFPLTYQVYF